MMDATLCQSQSKACCDGSAQLLPGQGPCFAGHPMGLPTHPGVEGPSLAYLGFQQKLRPQLQ